MFIAIDEVSKQLRDW